MILRLAALLLLGSVSAANAAEPANRPADLGSYQSAPPVLEEADGTDAKWSMRRQSVREAALSVGMQGGFVERTWEIQEDVRRNRAVLDTSYNFAALLIAAPSGFMIEPAIVAETEDDRVIAADGQRAARTLQRVRKITNARIVSAPRSWEDYLLYPVDPVRPVHPLNRPAADEVSLWKETVAEGWRLGRDQAELVYRDQHAALDRDFLGMILWRRLRAEGRVSDPVPVLVDRGITGNGEEVRIGDSEVQIREPSLLQPQAARWRAIPFVSGGGK